MNLKQHRIYMWKVNEKHMKKIIIIGNGNWGTSIAKVLAENVRNSKLFDNEILMYVHEELFEDRKLSEIINERHSNPIYLPGIKLHENIRAVTDISCANEADIIIVCVPHQFLGIIKDIKPKSSSFAINLSKGFIIENNELLMPSEYISRVLRIECCCLMGANIAGEVALEKLCECTIGFTQKSQIKYLKKMFNNDYFRTKILPFNKGMEVCGGLKNIISLAFGITRGMEWGSNAEAIVFRKGLVEIKKFCKLIGASFLGLESCCVGDLLTSCISGRNYKCGVELGSCKTMICDIEQKMSGQKLQGPDTAKTVYEWLSLQNIKSQKFPLLSSIYKICFLNGNCEDLKEALKSHRQ